MNARAISITAGSSYIIIFFAAIFANFIMLESLRQDPAATIQTDHWMVRLGIMAFLITVLFDVVVAWALYELYSGHRLSKLSTLFRMMHAAIMGVAVFALALSLSESQMREVLHHVATFDTIWLIGLFFFGAHLILLGIIIVKPRIIAVALAVAGVMYMADTTAHFVLPNYKDYSAVFLALVAIPSVLGEMSFALWLLVRGGKKMQEQKLRK